MKAFACFFALVLVAACEKKPEEQQPAAASTTTPPPGPAKGTPDWKIQNAMSAAPTSIAQAATVVEFGADGKPTQLRAGTNGWTCIADMADTPGNDPMCADTNFMEWVKAWVGHTKPTIKAAGIAYMLQGGSDASNTDPFKMKPDSGHAWVDTGPHVMMALPNVTALAGLPVDHKAGAPYVMWQGTPYAHVMLPVK